MLTQIVSPMVNTQIKLLAKSQQTRVTLIKTIAKWLGFLGVSAEVTELDSVGDKIKVSIVVGQPETSANDDWQQIVNNLNQEPSEIKAKGLFTPIPSHQETKYQRILAYALQMSYGDRTVDWEQTYPQLKTLGLEESTILGVKSALKVPQSIDRLINNLDADVAAVALSQTASIALLDREINSGEYQTLQTLLDAMTANC